MNRLARWAFAAHLVMMVFGLAGLTIAMRRPDLWAHSQVAVNVYAFGTRYAGVLQIVFATVAVLAYGITKLGARRTVIFFVCATSISLASELIGTGTGWPFGNYSYTSGLGAKIADRVPFTIPLSWFYMGLVTYLIGAALFQRVYGRAGTAARLAAGVWLLVVWDLVLDPAMAHESLSARFWIWHESGPYEGMPIQNFAGWAVTALAFMGLSRVLWRGEPPRDEMPGFPVMVYLANLAFGMAVCVSVGLWLPIGLGFVAGVLPAMWVLRGRRQRPSIRVRRHRGWGRVVDAVLRIGAGAFLRGWTLRPINLERLPGSGPVVLAVRHEHHLLDACALMALSPRPLRFLVALDWVRTPSQRFVMEQLCRWAGWPVILRPQRFRLADPPAVYCQNELPRYLVRGLREALRLLEDGEVVVVFPEGFPVIDPHTPGVRARLGHGFQRGVVWLCHQAAHRSGRPIPVIPVGIAYHTSGQKQILVQLGTPFLVSETTDLGAALASLESEVQILSGSVGAADYAMPGAYRG